MGLRLGVVGERISYSLSPRIFQWACRATGVDAEYRILQLPEAEFVSLVRSREGWNGLNVTVPYKSRAVELCDQIGPEVHKIGAVNTLELRDDLVIGSNTDAFGFAFALQQQASLVNRAERALVIGSGGAARAVIVALAEHAPHLKVTIASRDPASAMTKLRAQLFPKAIRCSSPKALSDELPCFDLVIQATPVGGALCPGMPLPEPLHFRPGTLVMDLVYAPRETAFLAAAREQGCITGNGLTMLLAQASRSFEQWTGRPFPLERALRELKPVLEPE